MAPRRARGDMWDGEGWQSGERWASLAAGVGAVTVVLWAWLVHNGAKE